MARNHAYTPYTRRYRYGTPSGLGPMARDLWQKMAAIVVTFCNLKSVHVLLLHLVARTRWEDIGRLHGLDRRYPHDQSARVGITLTFGVVVSERSRLVRSLSR